MRRGRPLLSVRYALVRSRAQHDRTFVRSGAAAAAPPLPPPARAGRRRMASSDPLDEVVLSASSTEGSVQAWCAAAGAALALRARRSPLSRHAGTWTRSRCWRRTKTTPRRAAACAASGRRTSSPVRGARRAPAGVAADAAPPLQRKTARARCTPGRGGASSLRCGASPPSRCARWRRRRTARCAWAAPPRARWCCGRPPAASCCAPGRRTTRRCRHSRSPPTARGSPRAATTPPSASGRSQARGARGCAAPRAALTRAPAAELAVGLSEGASAAAAAPAAAHTWTAHTLPVTGVAWGVGAGAPLVASVSLDRSAKVWSLCGGALLRTLVFPAALTALALDAADWTLFAGAMNGRIYAAPLSGDACPAEGGGSGAYELAGHTRPVRALAAAADGRRLVSGSDDGTIKARMASALALPRKAHRQGMRDAGVGAGESASAALGAARQGRAGDGRDSGAQGACALALRSRGAALTAPLRAQAALAPLRAASAAGVAREPLLPLAPFAKYASDALAAGAKPWEGPPVLLTGAGAESADEPFWVRAARCVTPPPCCARLTSACAGWLGGRNRAREQRAAGVRGCDSGARVAARPAGRRTGGGGAVARASRRAAHACCRPAVMTSARCTRKRSTDLRCVSRAWRGKLLTDDARAVSKVLRTQNTTGA